jgi:predicted nucleic acid-binding protein
MIRADFSVLLDACVLANHAVCDLILRLAEKPRLLIVHWSAEILAEVKRTHLGPLEWPQKIAESFQYQLSKNFPEAEVQGYEKFIPLLTNQEKDRHVLAAAIAGKCPVIITFNLKDFKAADVQCHGIEAIHPSDYLVTLFEMDPILVTQVLTEIAVERREENEDYLLILGKFLPSFSQRVLLDR